MTILTVCRISAKEKLKAPQKHLSFNGEERSKPAPVYKNVIPGYETRFIKRHVMGNQKTNKAPKSLHLFNVSMDVSLSRRVIMKYTRWKYQYPQCK